MRGERPPTIPSHGPTGQPYAHAWTAATACWSIHITSRPSMDELSKLMLAEYPEKATSTSGPSTAVTASLPADHELRDQTLSPESQLATWALPNVAGVPSSSRPSWVQQIEEAEYIQPTHQIQQQHLGYPPSQLSLRELSQTPSPPLVPRYLSNSYTGPPIKRPRDDRNDGMYIDPSQQRRRSGRKKKDAPSTKKQKTKASGAALERE